jgi:2-C-methyl-D-erythritol 4-phosphate cytidylyltransferase
MESAVKKQFMLLSGKPLVTWCLATLEACPSVQQIVLTVSPGDEHYCRTAVVDALGLRTPVEIVTGGDRRQDSVRNGLAAVWPDIDLVLIHDAARPLLTTAMADKALGAMAGRQAATMAVPVKDTVSLAGETGAIEQTLDRERLYLIQTPQIFERALIGQAHRKAQAEGFAGTDDASLVQRMGKPVWLLPGSYENIKITTPEDLVIAEAILRSRGALS